MPIVAFWSGDRAECGQTLSMAALATYMCVEHNCKTLMINASFLNDTLERCFWNVQKTNQLTKRLNAGKLDIASGAEGLVSAIASNKTSPEIVANYTKVIFKNRLDVLPGLKTTIREDHEKSLMLYKDLLFAANKYYDFVFIDVDKSYDMDTTKAILSASSIIMYVMPPNLRLINAYLEYQQTLPFLQGVNVIPLLAREDIESKYNAANVGKYIGYKGNMCSIPYNTLFMEYASEAKVAKFFLETRLSTSKADKNDRFISSVRDVDNKILEKLKELQYIT